MARDVKKPRGAMVGVQCHCGTLFQARAADVARGWGRFCSKACSKAKPSGPTPPAPSKGEATFAEAPVIYDPHDELFREVLHQLSNAIKLTTGQEATLIVWPKDVPVGALKPAMVGTYAGMRIIAPHAAVSLLQKKVP